MKTFKQNIHKKTLATNVQLDHMTKQIINRLPSPFIDRHKNTASVGKAKSSLSEKGRHHKIPITQCPCCEEYSVDLNKANNSDS